MDNLYIYEKTRAVPVNAQKKITGGRLNGFTDIQPVWRIKTLTELFGPVGIGWYTETLKEWIEPGPDGQVAAFVNINLYIKQDGEWSKPIFGTGGSMFAELAKGNVRTSDECYKMAHTDALSVCCKYLGFGADVYWEKDRTKYTAPSDDTPANNPPKNETPPKKLICFSCGEDIKSHIHNKKAYTASEVAANTKRSHGNALCWECAELAVQQAAEKQDAS